MAGGLTNAERNLASELIAPLLVPNSSFSATLTEQERDRQEAAVQPIVEEIVQGQVIVRIGDQVTEADLALIRALGLDDTRPDLAALGGWLLMSGLLVALVIAWLRIFRPEYWHRNNVVLLIWLLVAFATFALQLTAGRPALPFILPMAAIGILVAVLLDAETAVLVTAVVAIVAGAVNGPSLELSSYVLLGGLAGILAIRRGDKLQTFIQAGAAIFVVQAVVVTAFSLQGERDLTGVVQLIGAAAISAGGAAVAAVGSFAVLGNVFGLMTVFQLLELANPSQPLLRRLLLETPGTYHHSLMVGNLAERAAEIDRRRPAHHPRRRLLPRRRQAREPAGLHREPVRRREHPRRPGARGVGPDPEAARRGRDRRRLPGQAPEEPDRVHPAAPRDVGDGLLPAPRPARRRRRRTAGLETAEGQRAADTVDPRRFRHVGPKPQSREAALLMLADGVEASVRSLASRDEPAIRTMVARIINDRMEDGQFDECDLTLRDIGRAQEAFVSQLLGMYHQRVAYPQNKVVELESRRAAGGGGTPA